MNPKDIARLITEDVISESLYHLTTRDKVDGIKKSGLRWDAGRRYQDAGSGIYLFAGLDNWVHMREYLGDIEDVAIIQVNVDIDDPDMLMDEDSMSSPWERNIKDEFERSEPELAEELKAILAKTPEAKLEQAKQKFIEDHGLKPDYTDILRYQILTGRYIRQIPPHKIENIYYLVDIEQDSWKDLKPEEIAQRITSDPNINP